MLNIHEGEKVNGKFEEKYSGEERLISMSHSTDINFVGTHILDNIIFREPLASELTQVLTIGAFDNP